MSRQFEWKAIVAACVVTAAFCGTAAAQSGGVHYQHRADMPPGTIGQWQLQRGGPLTGYFQPIHLTIPDGAHVSFAVSGQFGPAVDDATAGLLIGQVYRLRIGGVAGAEDVEIFPTIEVIDRTYPPPDLIWKFPIEMEISREDLLLAAEGKFVTRVIYIEDPDTAVATRRDPKNQEYFDVPPGHDPLITADSLGRPVAIIRLGARTPQDPLAPGAQFLYGSPPLYLQQDAIGDSDTVIGTSGSTDSITRLPTGLESIQ